MYIAVRVKCCLSDLFVDVVFTTNNLLFTMLSVVKLSFEYIVLMEYSWQTPNL